MPRVTLCINGSDDACTGGTTRDATEDTPTTWRYTLTDDDYNLMGEGSVNLRATATVDGLSGTTIQDITVDTILPVVPTITTPISDDNIIGNNIDVSISGTYTPRNPRRERHRLCRRHRCRRPDLRRRHNRRRYQ